MGHLRSLLTPASHKSLDPSFKHCKRFFPMLMLKTAADCDAPCSHPFSCTTFPTPAGASLGIPTRASPAIPLVQATSLFSLAFPSPCSVPTAPLAVGHSPTPPQWLSLPCPMFWHSHDGWLGTTAAGDVMTLDELPREFVPSICETADWDVESS